VNRDVNIDGDVGYYGGGGYYGGYGWGGAIAAGAAFGLTAAAIGSVAYALPTGCASVYSYGNPYYNCGGTYYAPQYSGSSTTYVVVQAPGT